jgi:hypothetical protein
MGARSADHPLRPGTANLAAPCGRCSLPPRFHIGAVRGTRNSLILAWKGHDALSGGASYCRKLVASSNYCFHVNDGRERDS